MKYYFGVFIFSLFFIIAAAQPCRADIEDGAFIDTATVSALMSWVEQKTGVTVPVLPTVIASHTRLWNVLRAQSAAFAGRPQSLFVGGTVILNNRTWDPEDPVQISLLVHELVHYAQSFMRVRWACSDAKEVQAYTLQNLWLQQHGHEPFATAAWIERVSNCPSSSTVELAQQE